MSRSKLTPTLQCVDISKTYQSGLTSVTVLEAFSLCLLPGEIGMLMGPSGCGKTTLLMIAGGILLPDQGLCLVGNEDIFKLNPQAKVAFRANNISFIFQHLHLLPALSAIDNLALPLLIDGETEEAARLKAKELMVQLGLEIHLNSPLDNLSGGQKQRIAIGRALIRAPRLILCDEPTSNLDKGSTDVVFSLMKNYATQYGCSFLISTHDARITDFADKIFEFKGLNQYRLIEQKEQG